MLLTDYVADVTQRIFFGYWPILARREVHRIFDLWETYR